MKLWGLFCICAFVSLLTGCRTDISSRNDGFYNYRILGVYRINEPLFVYVENRRVLSSIANLAPLGFSGTSRSLEAFQRDMLDDNQVAGLLLPGDTIQVTRVLRTHNIDTGTTLDVYARVIKGRVQREFDKEITLNIISDGWPGQARVNTKLMQLVQ